MIQLINNNVELLRTAYNWQYDAPAWFQYCANVWKESEAEYLANAPNELHYGVFDNDDLVASVRLIEVVPYAMILHFSVKRQTTLNNLLEQLIAIKHHVINSPVQVLFGYIPSFNRGTINLYKQLGFTDTGARCYKGVWKGKSIKWLRFELSCLTT